MDVLSQFLTFLPVATSLDWRCELNAPWKLVNEGTAAGIAPFHLIVEGEAWLETDDGTEIALNSGDFLMLPQGSPHILHAGSKSGPTPEIHPSVATVKGMIKVEGKGARTEILCGEFHFDPVLLHILIKAFPNILLLQSRKREKHSPLYELMLILKKETQQPLLGADAIVKHLSAALFSLVIRGWIQEASLAANIFRVLSEPRLYPALHILMQSPEKSLTLELLASTCHMSRATFIRLFNQAAGDTPGNVITQLRIMHAAKLLLNKDQDVSAISEMVGYSSKPAFYRAFKQRMGLSPSAYRKRQILQQDGGGYWKDLALKRFY